MNRRTITITIVALTVIGLLLSAAGVAQAYPMNCKPIPRGQVCISSTTGRPTGRCDLGYELLANMTCRKLPARPWAPWFVPPGMRP